MITNFYVLVLNLKKTILVFLGGKVKSVVWRNKVAEEEIARGKFVIGEFVGRDLVYGVGGYDG